VNARIVVRAWALRASSANYSSGRGGQARRVSQERRPQRPRAVARAGTRIPRPSRRDEQRALAVLALQLSANRIDQPVRCTRISERGRTTPRWRRARGSMSNFPAAMHVAQPSAARTPRCRPGRGRRAPLAPGLRRGSAPAGAAGRGRQAAQAVLHALSLNGCQKIVDGAQIPRFERVLRLKAVAQTKSPGRRQKPRVGELEALSPAAVGRRRRRRSRAARSARARSPRPATAPSAAGRSGMSDTR